MAGSAMSGRRSGLCQNAETWDHCHLRLAFDLDGVWLVRYIRGTDLPLT